MVADSTEQQNRTFIISFVGSGQNGDRNYGIGSIGARMVEGNVETTTLKIVEAGHESFEVAGGCDLRSVSELKHGCRPAATTPTAFQSNAGADSLVACLGKRLKAVALPTAASSAMADMERELIRMSD